MYTVAGVPGVLSVQPDENFDSDNKNYGGLRSYLDFNLRNATYLMLRIRSIRIE